MLAVHPAAQSAHGTEAQTYSMVVISVIPWLPMRVSAVRFSVFRMANTPNRVTHKIKPGLFRKMIPTAWVAIVTTAIIELD
ncbi:uncharacterized protein EV420DRAFT_1582374 [Desarmillaria tabescens]|uniref:Uncharacterized protein n=1 Tax=Armillaria tabescens TaxID=1929756 RepID=A0AA39JDI8_ARMTA|nr:uncharacterized protein EV420DRAFT_1582374 [Desarmillaria tabescens]KAK0440037.1 hypothetical protein EV420DRAFT_1582374 [Desarmillaria tabescens]